MIHFFSPAKSVVNLRRNEVVNFIGIYNHPNEMERTGVEPYYGL